MNTDIKNINQYIDHTILKADTTFKDIQKVCNEAKEYKFKSVCVPPSYVYDAKMLLKGTDVIVCTVIGFPLGFNTTVVKVAETIQAINEGATEVDVVLPIGRLKNLNLEYIEEELLQVNGVCKENNVVLKVIIETALLNDEEKVIACKICSMADVDFVKTSTGYSTSGATIQDVELLREALPDHIQIKASGGIKTKKFALDLLNAGATRLGCSSSVKIVNE